MAIAISTKHKLGMLLNFSIFMNFWRKKKTQRNVTKVFKFQEASKNAIASNKTI
jgi:hypothetical protein